MVQKKRKNETREQKGDRQIIRIVLLFLILISFNSINRIEGRPDWVSGCRTGSGQGRANHAVATDADLIPFGARGSGTAVPIQGGGGLFLRHKLSKPHVLQFLFPRKAWRMTEFQGTHACVKDRRGSGVREVALRHREQELRQAMPVKWVPLRNTSAEIPHTNSRPNNDKN